MIWKSIIFLGFALCVLGDGHHAISEQKIKMIYKEHSKQHSQEHSKETHGHHGELSHLDSKEPEHHGEYAWSYPSYEFSYKVHDPHTHDFKGQHETKKGHEVKGEYWLIEPDGRMRIVTYNADKHNGYHAIVHYSDDHHHIYDEHNLEKHSKEDESNEEKKSEEIKEEEKKEEKKEAAPVEEEKEEEVHNNEENHDHKEEVGKWLHDRHWSYHSQGKLHDYNGYEEHKYSPSYMEKDHGWHTRDEIHKVEPMINFKNLENYGHDDKHDKDDKDEEENLRRPEQRPLHKSGTVIRENYYHPRFYRLNQRESAGL